VEIRTLDNWGSASFQARKLYLALDYSYHSTNRVIPNRSVAARELACRVLGRESAVS
jgi:hypothetical protein